MKKLLVTLVATTALAASFAVTAGAEKPDRTLATPAAACSIMVEFGVGGYMSFGDCMRRVHTDVADLRFPSDADPAVLISLNERCAEFEGQFLTYPFLFEEGPDWPFPTLTAQNRQQCMFTLYTYHTLAGA